MPCGNFREAFKNNMAALGLPAPDSLFSSVTTTTSNLSAMLNALSKLGPNATVAELVGATTGLEGLMVVAAVSAAAYTGAVIGSLAIAASSTLICTHTSQVGSSTIQWASRNGLNIPPDLRSFIRRHPELIVSRPGRHLYAIRQRASLNKNVA